jgi:hypothetical protein
LAIYDHVDGSVLLNFSCSGFACGFKLCAEIPEYCVCYDSWVWPNGELEDWK